METDKDLWFRKTLIALESPLLGYAFRIVKRMAPSEEVVQDSFLRLWKQEYPKFENHYPKAWLYKVARNLAIDYLRKEQRVELSDELEEILSTPCINEKLLESSLILQKINDLPKSQQELLFLKFSEDLTYAEISEATGLSVSNVGYKLHHALESLKDIILAELK